MLLLDVGSRECGMTQRATKGLLIRICPCFVRQYIEESGLGCYCTSATMSHQMLGPGERPITKVTLQATISSAGLRWAGSRWAGGRGGGGGAGGRAGGAKDVLLSVRGAERDLRTFLGESLGLTVSLLCGRTITRA